MIDAVGPAGKAPVAEAAEMCRKMIGEDLAKRRISLIPPPAASKKGFDTWRKEMKQKRTGEVAPLLIMECVEAACKGPTFADGLKVEAAKFSGKGGVMDPETSQFQELQYMFSAERAGGKLDGIVAKPMPIKIVGIVGGGLMGGGIGMSCAEAGMHVKI